MVLSVRTRTRTVHLPEHTRAILGHTTGIYKPHGMSHGLSFYCGTVRFRYFGVFICERYVYSHPATSLCKRFYLTGFLATPLINPYQVVRRKNVRSPSQSSAYGTDSPTATGCPIINLRCRPTCVCRLTNIHKKEVDCGRLYGMRSHHPTILPGCKFKVP